MAKRILTGVKPTGQPHIGNWLGAIRPALGMVNEPGVESYLFIADYHSLISVHDAEELRKLTREVAATWLSCGLDPKKTLIYRQSEVPEVFELAWILACFTPKGFMNRAHAYKAKLSENETLGSRDPDHGVSVGLFTYPVLMAADILLFRANEVPVGEDQIQHLEFARDIVEKFNKTYGNLLVAPQAKIQKGAALIPGLDGRKMSKSYGNHIPLFLDSKALRKSVMRIKTDSLPPEAPKPTEGSILLDIYRQVADPEEVLSLESQFQKGISWGGAKEILFEKLDQKLTPGREVFNDWLRRPQELERLLSEGATQARAQAQPLMSELRRAVGVGAMHSLPSSPA